MLYRNKQGQLFSRSMAIASILKELGTVIEPSYIDDNILAIYDFVLDEHDSIQQAPTITREQRKNAMASFDWVSTAKHLTGETKISVEAWRTVIRNSPNCYSIPPVPKLHKKVLHGNAVLNSIQVDKIKNYITKDTDWLLFLEVWKNLDFNSSEIIVANLLKAYTKVKLNEIIGSI